MNLENLNKKWLHVASNYSDDVLFLDSVWKTIVKKYSEKNRFYHNLNHIQTMIKLAEENKSEIIDFDSLLFSIWFHDIIYTSTSKKNEEKSAEFAKKYLLNFSISSAKIHKICKLIISTKKHQIELSEHLDNAFLLDFDLAILGQSSEIYKNYITNIRREYKIYPDFIYKPGRKKVLTHFLERKTLFFTQKYQNLFEEKARINLEKELITLS